MSINPLFRDHINFRDLGGYETLDGRHIKPGLLYRSGGLYLMDDQEIENFLSLGIKFIMDFRTTAEATAKPDPVFPEIEIIRHSGLEFRGGEEIDFSPIGMSKIGKEGHHQLDLLKKYYNQVPFDNEAFRILMKAITEEKAPLVFHCYTGKDRTGVFAMILLLALGVPEETVFRDYLLSNEFHKIPLEKALNDKAETIKTNPEVKELTTMWFGVSEDIGREVLSSIHSKYGSLEEYFLQEFNLDSKGLDSLRNMYTI